MNLGTSIDKLHELKKTKAEIEKQLKAIKDDILEAEAEVFEKLNEQGVTLSRGTTATASITESIIPSVEDWDAFYGHILDTGDVHLLERRPATRAYRELYEAGEEVPGIAPFTKRTLNLRKI
jgi:hypothetical protein